MTGEKLPLVYVSNARIPGDRAHAHQSVLVCEALQRAGAEVELIHPARSGVAGPASDAELARLYGVEEPFRVTQLGSLDLIDRFPPALQRPWFLLQELTYAAHLRRYLADKPDAVVYVRDPHTLFFLRCLGVPAKGRMVFEAHRVPRTRMARVLLARALADTLCVMALNPHLAAQYRALLGASETQVAVVPSAADRRKFHPRADSGERRRRLEIAADAAVVCYAGSLQKAKGIDTLLECARRLPEVTVLVVGGWPPVGPRLQRFCRDQGLTNVRFTGQVSPLEVADYLLLADVLVAPNSAGSSAAADETSPLKFFEYVAAGKPIVASDVPALRAAAAECRGCVVVWVRADDPDRLAEGIRAVLERSKRDGGADSGARGATAPDWLDRGRAILRHIEARRAERHVP